MMATAQELPIAAQFPPELVGRRQWLVWRFVLKPGQKKPSKMPYYATTGHLRGWPLGKPRDGQPTEQQPQVDQGHELDREHLVDFERAAAFAAARRFDGVGFAFLPGDGLIGIDLDGAVGGDDDRSALGLQVMADCDTFGELSPSGSGLHIIGLGEVETFKSNDVGIEVFCGRQFFTMTGSHHPDTPFEVREIPEETLGYLRSMVDRAKEAARQAKEAARPAPAPAAPAAPAPGTTAASRDEATRYCLAALDSAVQRLRSAREGGRNDLLNGEAYGLGQLLHTGGISEATVRAALTDAAKSCGLSASEINSTLRSGLESGKRSPKAIPPRQYRAPAAAPAARRPAAPTVDPDTGEILDDVPPPANDNQAEEEAPAAAAPAEWPDPIDPFGVAPPPELPIDVLPEPFRDYVRDQAALLGSDPAVIGLSAIVAAAACIHDDIELQPKRHDPTWTESARLWVAIVGDPSAKKSPAIRKAMRQVYKIDMNMAADNGRALADYEHQHAEWKEAKEAKKAKNSGDLVRAEPKRPPMRRLVVEDTTVEALSEVLRDNPAGVLTYKDELTGWFASMDAYKGGSKGASMDRAHWLEAYNGGRRLIDRVNRGNIVVPNWSTCIIGGIQPDMMRKVSANMGNDGLLQRFMVLVARPAQLDEDRVPDMDAMERFRAMFDQLVAIGPSGNKVKLSDGAHVIRERVARRADAMVRAFDHPHLVAWLGKWTGLFARLLLTYHVIECAASSVYPTTVEVSAETARQVERLMCDVLLHHAVHFYTEVIDQHERQENVRQLARLIVAKRLDRLTKRDITLGWKASRKLEPWALRAVAETLCTLGWLDPEPGSIDSSDGKPKAWGVNPKVHEAFSAQGEREAERRREAHALLREMSSR